MATKLGSKLAQLANAKKQAVQEASLTPEDLDRIEAEKAAINCSAVHLLLLPHVDEFNEAADKSLHISLEKKQASIAIKQSWLNLLTVEMTSKAAVFKRKGADYTSDDYFTLGGGSDGTMTFRRYAAEVEKPLTANQFAEFVLMEALGLNE